MPIDFMADLSCIHRRRYRHPLAHFEARIIREAFTRYKITYMAVVPLILKNCSAACEKDLRRCRLESARAKCPDPCESRIHAAAAAARSQPAASEGHPPGFRRRITRAACRRRFYGARTDGIFHDLGIPIYNGYGCTEACTAITVNDLRPFRPESVGRPVQGMEIRIVEPDATESAKWLFAAGP